MIFMRSSKANSFFAIIGFVENDSFTTIDSFKRKLYS